MEPGTANTSRPCSSACCAVISEPLVRAASTTSVPSDSPLMMRLRCGKCCAPRFSARRKLRHERAALANARGERRVPARIHDVEPAAAHGDRGAVRAQRAFVARRVDAEREPAGDGEAGAREERGEIPRGARPLAVGLREPTMASCGVDSAATSPSTYSTGGARLSVREQRADSPADVHGIERAPLAAIQSQIRIDRRFVRRREESRADGGSATPGTHARRCAAAFSRLPVPRRARAGAPR